MLPTPAEDERFMRLALDCAERAAARGEVPVGAVGVSSGLVVAGAGNLREGAHDPTAHAELIVIQEAAKRLGRWRLSDLTLYVTLEPCFMCAGAIVNARIGRVVYGAVDPKAGAVESLASVLSDTRLNHAPRLTGGVLAEPSGALLRAFFRARRA